MRLLVVCAGNTCRSPAAEAAIRRAGERAGLDLDVFSAGTSAEHVGTPPTPAMVEAGRARGLEISGTAKQVAPADLESADLILTMDRQTELFLSTLGAVAPVELLASFDVAAANAEIADPYGGDAAAYAETLDRIISASEALVASLTD